MQENFTYSLLASGLGILIVFSILVLLSVLMVIIRKLADNENGKSSVKTETSSQPLPQASSKPGLPLPVLVAAATAAQALPSRSRGWISAAVAAFLASEEDDLVLPRTASWIAADTDKYDPWVANKKFPKSVSGA